MPMTRGHHLRHHPDTTPAPPGTTYDRHHRHHPYIEGVVLPESPVK